MLLSITYQQVRPSPKIWTYARQSLQNLELHWGSELELRLSLQANRLGVRATLSGRDKLGHAIAASVTEREAFTAVGSLVIALEQQSQWIKKRPFQSPSLQSYGAHALS